MGITCGIVGLPNVGKSTIFNALTRSSVPAANYPFCTIDPNVGVVQVPDPRLSKLGELVPTEEVVPTVMQFVDIAGLVKGASEGAGLGNQFLARITEVDAIAHVVRCFEDPDVVHVTGAIDPKRDIEIVETELALKDLGVVTSAIRRLEKSVKGGDKKAAAVLGIYKELEEPLNEGRPVRSIMPSLPAEAWEAIKPLNLLTAKPLLYIANVAERDATNPDAPFVTAVREIAKAQGAGLVVICGAIEAQIAALESEEERAEFLAAVGLSEPGLHRMIRAGYELLGLITFFSVGPKQDRAWTVRKGVIAPQAAGQIHSDMERGFIRAEVISYEDFVTCGSEAAARERGKLRLEGKEYVVRDGDIMYFRFNV